MPELGWIDDEETLTYLHSTVSTRRQRVRVPEIPVYLDAVLADQPLTGGLEPMLGNSHLRVLTVVGFPTVTTPGYWTSLTGLHSLIAGRHGRSCSTRLMQRGC